MGFKYTVVCDTFGFLGHDILDQPREILRAIKQAGYDGVDLPGNPKRMDGEAMREMVREVGLEVPELLGAWAYFHGGEDRDLAGGNPEARKRGVEYAKATIDLASTIGAHFFEICAAQPPAPELPFPRLSISTLRRNFIGAVREICAYASERDIAIIFEPLNCYEAYPGVLTSVYEAMSLCRELEPYKTGIQPDISHMNISDPVLTEALRAVGPYIRHVHVNETHRYRLGTGHADWRGILRTLKDIGFEGYLAVYMPYVSQEAWMGTEGYGSSGTEPSGAGRISDLSRHLEDAISFLKDVERSVEAEPC